jgi:hypothetical protein
MYRSFIRNKRGISGLLGGVFLMLILLGGFSLIFWEIIQHDNYMQVAAERDQQTWELTGEIIEISEVNIVGGDSFNITVVNKGASTAHLVDLWVTEYLGVTPNWHVLFPLDRYINPGDIATNVAGEIDIPELNPELDYKVKIVTERGNIVMKKYEPEIEPGTGGELIVGPFILEFSTDAFQYTSDVNQTTPLPAFQIDNDRRNLLFWIQFFNRATRNIQISQLSFLLLEVRQLYGEGQPGTTEYERYCHIADPASDSSNLLPYSPDYMQTIPSEEYATLKFGARYVGGNTFLPGEPLHEPNSDDWNNLLWVFLVVFWRYEPTVEDPNPATFGQTITYIAIHSTP